MTVIGHQHQLQCCVVEDVYEPGDEVSFDRVDLSNDRVLTQVTCFGHWGGKKPSACKVGLERGAFNKPSTRG